MNYSTLKHVQLTFTDGTSVDIDAPIAVNKFLISVPTPDDGNIMFLVKPGRTFSVDINVSLDSETTDKLFALLNLPHATR